jgi:imidazolonepropionase-like amidohydrolase
MPYKGNDETTDLKGRTIAPGFVEGHCHIGMWEDSTGFEGDDGNEDTDPSTPHLRAIDAVNVLDRCFFEALSAGITTVVTGPGSANPIGGQFVALKTYGKNVDEMILKEPICIKMALGENPKTVYHSKNQAPVTRMATAAIIREQLFKASRYIEDKNKAKDDCDFDEPEFCIKSEALIPVFEGKIPLHIHAHRHDDILTALRICKEFSINCVIVHGTDGAIVAEQLAKNNVGVILGPSLCDRSKPELKNLSFSTASVLNKNSVKFAITTDHPATPIQYLPLCAALSVKYGADKKTALNAITINAAQLCGIDDRVGSLRIGKDANFTVFDGEPLELYTNVLQVFIDGQLRFDAKKGDL